MNQKILTLLPHMTTIFLILRLCTSLDTISVHKNIIDGETIVSANDKFELGFFSPGSSKHRYLGIWFKNISPRAVIWVANRETPLTNTLGMLRLDNQGILSIFNGDAGKTIWSSTSFTYVVNPIAQLLDTGNLVITDANSVIWESFDYPGDTLISGMKLGKNFVTGRELYLTSWRSADDPSTGEHTVSFSMEEGIYPQFYIKKSSIIETRIGPYDGTEFAGLPKYTHTSNHMCILDMDVRQNEKYFRYYTFNLTTVSFKSTVNPSGKLEISRLNNESHEWMQDHTIPADYCDNYGLCGPYGSCNTATFPTCKCLKGFELNSPQLDIDNSTSGCTRKRPLDCGPEEGFLKLSSMKLPDTQNAVFNSSLSIQECEVACKGNCSCTAFANPNTTAGGLGCLLWFGDLIDVRVYSQNGQDLHVRLAAIELSGTQVQVPNTAFHFYKRKRVLILVVSTSSSLVLLLAVTYACIKKNRKSRMKGRGKWYALQKKNTNVQIEDLDELPFFSLHKIAKATDNFSINNKIGEGGFGPVYKGVFEDGQEVAIKRLSETSKQGLDEFKNEVLCIAKLQHRNLVKLLGYCVHGNEMILIYEYMANKSLDTILFDETRSIMLDWPKRLNIIHGIARGILYLHQDSRLQIIHRDLKAANILLVTYGYISPEYAVHGRFSVKSDVFSFGVLVLETVSGKKNRGFSHKGHNDNLLGHAWRLYKEGRTSELMDAALHGSCSVSKVLRSIHVGLLCVQQHANDRPTMLSVVLMLVSEGVLPQPKQPAYFTGESDIEAQSVLSAGEEIITQLYGR